MHRFIEHKTEWLTTSALALISAYLLALSFPHSDINPVSWFSKLSPSFPGYDFISWIAFIPLFFAIENKTPGKSFKTGFFTGVLHFLMLLYWIIPTIHRYGGIPLFLCIPILLLLTFYLALYMGLFTFLMTRLSGKPGLMIFVLPFIWVSLEFMRSVLFTGFPWELLGYSLYNRLYMRQIADITGVYGLSYIIVLINLILYHLICEIRYRENRMGRVYQRCLILIVTGLLVPGAVYFYGNYRVFEIDALSGQGERSVVSVVQGNIDQAEKWDLAYQDVTMKRYYGLSQFAKGDGSSLVIWPETAAPFLYGNHTRMTAELNRRVRETGIDFLIGIPSVEKRQDETVFFNSAYLIPASGEAAGRYDKAHLVPYGEYVPLKAFFPFIKKLVAQAGNFQEGKDGATVNWQDKKIAVQICFEIIFPSLTRKAVKDGASLIVNITNDAWFGTTGAPFQHFSMLIFRSVENRRSLARAANTGISGFIDPAGRVMKKTSLFEQDMKSEAVPLLDIVSFYTRYGDLFAWVSLLISMVAIGVNIRNNSIS